MRASFFRAVGYVSIRITAVLAIIAAITFICFRLIAVNATSVGFAYLIAILLIATAWGLLEATVASVAAVLCFNYYFLPPIGTFTIADPQNWVALFAFLVTSIIASQLSARAKRRTQEAVDRRLEMERLYALSRAILLTDINQSAAKQVAHQIAQIFEFPAVALYDRTTGEVHRAGPEDLPGVDDKLRQAAVQGTLFQDPSNQTIVTSIRLGGEPIGSVAIRGASLPDTALQALANIVAIGLEKVRGQEAANRAEAARQSEELKSTLLDAIAHEFKTPLTSIKAAASALLSENVSRAEEEHELITIVNEEADRLGRLVTDAIEMARIEAGKIKLNRQTHSVNDLVSRVLQQMKPVTEGRTISAHIANGLPVVVVDGELIELALRQLLDNALKYSPPASPVELSAELAEGGVVIRVRDRGPGIPDRDQGRIFEKFYRGSNTRQQVIGTGMGLTIAREILRAHGGDIWVKSSPGQGSEFCLSLPFASQEKIA
jgi:two-component system sensor histidine kinase KdpD